MPTHTYNSRVYYDSDGLSSYTELSGVTDVQFPDIAASNTPADALVDLVKKTIAGKVDVGKVTHTVLYDKTVQAAIIAMFRVDYYWRWQWPDANPVTNGSKLECVGYIDSYTPPNMDDDGTLKFTFTVKLNAIPTFTPAV